MNLLLEEIANFVNGELINNYHNNIIVLGISTDSRNIRKGELFIPLVGEKFDGHFFINVAQQNGAVAAIWQKNKPVPAETTIPIILVKDTLKGLQELAIYYRNKINPKVVAVTGSNGKTTTKDIITSIVATKFRVHSTKGNFNNHIGLPLTILNMPEDTEILVVELGMSSLGEIELLSHIASPDIALITNIGESHLEYLKTRENIAKAKLEITKGLKNNGYLILNGDEPLLRQQIIDNDKYNAFWVGHKTTNDIYPIDITSLENRISFIDNNHNQFDIPLIGKHNVINSLMAIKIAQLLNIDYNNIQKGLNNLNMTGMRLEKSNSRKGSLILNDAYNASPTSMKAGLDLLASLKNYDNKIAVLGDMLELGERASYYHREIGKICADKRINYLFTIGKYGKMIAEGSLANGMSKKNVYYLNTKEDIVPIVEQLSDDKTVIYVKASRGMKLDEIVRMLI